MEEIKKEKCCNTKCHGGFGALFLITIGSLLLLNNFKLLSWDIWDALWRFWPILLVIWGLKMIFGRGILGNIIVTILSLILLFSAVFYSVSLVDKDFDNWIGSLVPQWKNLKKEAPTPSLYNWKFQQRQRIFRCDPFDDSCYLQIR